MAGNTTVMTSDIEHLIVSISGVSAAKVVTDEEGRIVEIHVLADTSKSPKQLVRDIQSGTMAAFGLPIDYKIISVAQIEHGMQPAAVVAPTPVRISPRLLCDGMTVHTNRSTVEVVVTLDLGGKIFEGRSQGPLTERGRLHACASSVLDAVHAYLGSEGILQLLEVQKIHIAGLDAIEAAVCLLDGDREVFLLGSVFIRQRNSEDDAVVRAVLDALNRAITRSDRN